MDMSSYRVGPVLAVADVERAAGFYEGKLGLKPSAEMGGGKVYDCAGETGLFVYPSPEHAGKSTATLVGWEVDDVARVVDELTAQGVVFEQYDQGDLRTDEKGIATPGGTRVAFFRDPDGNTHAVNEAG